MERNPIRPPSGTDASILRGVSFPSPPDDPLARFHAATRRWFAATLGSPTEAQARAWPPVQGGRSVLLLAPTGSGKTLAAFLAALDALAFGPPRASASPPGVRVLYVSPLKALGVDVERNLRVPIAGLREAAAAIGVPFREPRVGVRSGDTPPAERARLVREPPDVLITTPESLYLLLTSRAAGTLRSVETVIVDEIHAVAGTKRGAHLFLSLERLEELRGPSAPPLRRIGLSATQRPLERLARLLAGGCEGRAAGAPFAPRDVVVVDAGRRRATELDVQVPVDDMTAPGPASVAADETPRTPSLWPHVHERLVELIRAHRSTLVFVNARLLAERLAGALNAVAGEELALAHHGSLSKELRADVEERLKRGELRALVATSSLELGIDMGAIDLVVQVEAPPSVASGLQRVGRAGHQVGAVSRGIVLPKHRHDLLVATAAAEAMRDAGIEETRVPENPLDVVAQQIVASVVQFPGITAERLFALVRRAAPFADLPRASFDGLLDLLAGRYPSERFGELRPRITWNRTSGALTPRAGALRLAVLNAGTIPDRGLYGVFLDGAERVTRVGELDEEMVHETGVGDVIVLGASSWRVRAITHDRVLVAPAPGEPGRTPFWKGDRVGRPAELGRRVGALARRVAASASPADLGDLGLDPRAAANLHAYVHAQAAAAGVVPSETTLVVERFTDEVGDRLVCLLSPFGDRVHRPWAEAVRLRLRSELGIDAECVTTDDGIVFRLPQADAEPALALFLPAADEVEPLLVRRLADTSLFASRFRENAVRALLLPRREAARRRPLWLQRKRAADLLQVAADFPEFPILLETYRECLRDVFDLPALRDVLADVHAGRVAVRELESARPSPFAASLLFGYAASFIYDDDAPLAERRARALAIDHVQLARLLGEPELRTLLATEEIDALEAALQRRDGARPLAHADALHDALLALGPLGDDEIAARCADTATARRLVGELLAAGRALRTRIATAERVAAVEDAARLRDALGAPLPVGIPDAFLVAAAEPLDDLVRRHARTHGPFRAEDVAARLGIGSAPVAEALARLVAGGALVAGEFLPRGSGTEWCDADVLRRLRGRSLAAARRAVEPVSHAALARFALAWHGIDRPRRGLDALYDAVVQLAGEPLPASDLLDAVLPARIDGFDARDLDELAAAGEIGWRGAGALPGGDGRIALVAAGDALPDLRAAPPPPQGALHDALRATLRQRGAVLFGDLLRAADAYPPDVVAALWDLVWSGEVTNDTFLPLRARRRGADARLERRRRDPRARRPATPPGTEGRWSPVPEAPAPATPAEATSRAAAFARALLDRHGVLTREAVVALGAEGGYGAVYPVLRALEDSGRARRGLFVEGVQALQFALPGAIDRLRALRDDVALRDVPRDVPHVVALAACDPAQPYGAALPWPGGAGDERPQRGAGARVFLRDGALLGWLGRGGRRLVTLGAAEPRLRELAGALAAHWERSGGALVRIDGADATRSPARAPFEAHGFRATSRGLVLTRRRLARPSHDDSRT